MSRLLRYIEARLSERSTWVGLSAVLTSAIQEYGQYLGDAEKHTITVAIIAAGAVASIMASGGTPPNPPPAGPQDGPADPAQS
jgi:hypothetical protein